MRIIAIAFASSLLCAAGLTGQVAPNGAGVVEFLGLDEWTPDRIRSKLGGGSAPAQIHYCAANLLEIGMADAAVMYHSMGPKPYVVVTVIEPQHAERVRYLPAPEGAAEPVAAWHDLHRATRDQGMAAQIGVVHYAAYRNAGREAALAKLANRASHDEVLALWHMIEGLASADDRDLAVWTLQHDPDAGDRACAATILINFAEHDLSWWALVRGLRDGDAGVRSACSRALNSMTRAVPRPVDWQPVAGSLRPLLGGTNLFAFSHLLETLVATGVEAELAGLLLGGNAHLVLAYLGAKNEYEHGRARRLLVALAGKDLGEDMATWRRWADSLDAP
ncbi:MAG: hypothetical protein AAF628_12955 [Planctomycetota bacterium]